MPLEKAPETAGRRALAVRYTERLHHSSTQVIGLQVDHQVIMSWHQTVGQDLYQFGLEIVSESFDKITPVLSTEKDRLAVYASIV